MNAADRFPQTAGLIVNCYREFLARQRPALWFWGDDVPFSTKITGVKLDDPFRI